MKGAVSMATSRIGREGACVARQALLGHHPLWPRMCGLDGSGQGELEGGFLLCKCAGAVLCGGPRNAAE